ncbi:MAG: general secretion pathway protein G [Arenicella sp.]|jgi:general secretion pathway protein G
MYQQINCKVSGFSMVELLVTLVLIGLVASFVAPGVDAWLSSREAAAIRIEVTSKLAIMPLQVNRAGESLIIDNSAQLNLAHLPIIFEQPVIILSNGFCMGGRFSIEQKQRTMSFDVLQPYCEVRRSEIK